MIREKDTSSLLNYTLPEKLRSILSAIVLAGLLEVDVKVNLERVVQPHVSE